LWFENVSKRARSLQRKAPAQLPGGRKFKLWIFSDTILAWSVKKVPVKFHSWFCTEFAKGRFDAPHGLVRALC
jgi:hypothetical protein